MGPTKNQYRDAVIGHSQGTIDALRDAPELARYNPRVTIITVDPPRTSVLFHCVRGVRYLDLHTGEFGLGGTCVRFNYLQALGNRRGALGN
jgi:hypothetical protein